jgi:hypothetical protein
LATCVPPSAKKRNSVVPTNSPIIATVSGIQLAGDGIQLEKGSFCGEVPYYAYFVF